MKIQCTSPDFGGTVTVDVVSNDAGGSDHVYLSVSCGLESGAVHMTVEEGSKLVAVLQAALRVLGRYPTCQSM